MRYGQREHRNDCSPAFDTGDSLPAYVTGDSLPRSTPNDWKYSRLQVTARQSSLRRPSTCAKTHATGGALTSANAM